MSDEFSELSPGQKQPGRFKRFLRTTASCIPPLAFYGVQQYISSEGYRVKDPVDIPYLRPAAHVW